MEFYQSVVLAVTVIVVAVLGGGRFRLPGFLALVAGALLFAILADMSFPSIGDAFSLGFAQTVDSYGLIIIAGCVTAAFAELSGASAQVAMLLPATPRAAAASGAALGLVASLASPAPVALALLKPWHRLSSNRAATVTALALALTAGQALIYPSIYAVATGAILKVGAPALLALGVPLALLAAGCGWLFVIATAPVTGTENAEPSPEPAPQAARSSLLIPTLIPLLLLFAAAVAQIPVEPLGREAKHWFVFLTRPTVILTLSLVLVLLMYRRWGSAVLSQDGWIGAALAASVPPLLAVGAAGGFAGLIQATGMAELVAEAVVTLPLGILVPFTVAATMKALQGSAMVATLTTAGMIEPMLAALGLDDATGRALTAAAIGGGVMVAHINDPYFWLVADAAGTSPGRTLRLYTLGTLVQAAAVAAALLVLSALL